ncbi:unnamed protein product [Amoebophrya sp. A25]|nr:unnamed protein product [Amoebophrya sp. A25]|eukprot:GSA25T00022705001.1
MRKQSTSPGEEEMISSNMNAASSTPETLPEALLAARIDNLSATEAAQLCRGEEHCEALLQLSEDKDPNSALEKVRACLRAQLARVLLNSKAPTSATTTTGNHAQHAFPPFLFARQRDVLCDGHYAIGLVSTYLKLRFSGDNHAASTTDKVEVDDNATSSTTSAAVSGDAASSPISGDAASTTDKVEVDLSSWDMIILKTLLQAGNEYGPVLQSCDPVRFVVHALQGRVEDESLHQEVDLQGDWFLESSLDHYLGYLRKLRDSGDTDALIAEGQRRLFLEADKEYFHTRDGAQPMMITTTPTTWVATAMKNIYDGVVNGSFTTASSCSMMEVTPAILANKVRGLFFRVFLSDMREDILLKEDLHHLETRDAGPPNYRNNYNNTSAYNSFSSSSVFSPRLHPIYLQIDQIADLLQKVFLHGDHMQKAFAPFVKEEGEDSPGITPVKTSLLGISSSSSGTGTDTSPVGESPRPRAGEPSTPSCTGCSTETECKKRPASTTPASEPAGSGVKRAKQSDASA